MPGPGARRRRALSALLCCHAAAAFLGARPITAPRAHRAEANDDGDDNDGDDAVIGLDSLPDELQSQIVEAIARSRLRDGKAEGVISTNEDGAASLFLFGNEDSHHPSFSVACVATCSRVNFGQYTLSSSDGR